MHVTLLQKLKVLGKPLDVDLASVHFDFWAQGFLFAGVPQKGMRGLNVVISGFRSGLWWHSDTVTVSTGRTT